MATRTSVQTDDFADNNLSAGSVIWTQLNPSNAPMDNIGGVVLDQYGQEAAISADGTYTNDQYSKLALATGTTNDAATWLGVIARASTDTDAGRDYYFFYISFAQGSSPFDYVLGKMVNGTPTTLQTGTTAFVVGNTIEIEVDGSTTTSIRGYINGTLINTATDSSSPLTTGKPGITIKKAIIAGDNWEGGNLTASATNWGRLLGGEINRLVMPIRVT